MEDEDLFLQSNTEFEDEIPRLEVCILLALLFLNLFLAYNLGIARHENLQTRPHRAEIYMHFPVTFHRNMDNS